MALVGYDTSSIGIRGGLRKTWGKTLDTIQRKKSKKGKGRDGEMAKMVDGSGMVDGVVAVLFTRFGMCCVLCSDECVCTV